MPGRQYTLFTIGHSTHSLQELVDMLRSQKVKVLADVRTVPKSRHVPQFNSTSLARRLPPLGIEYIHLKDLGGLRKARKDSINAGWRNASFRGYADYMQTPEFEAALEHLEKLARRRRTAIMCAEALPWRCHRSLIADALIARGWRVMDIMSGSNVKEHALTPFAHVEGTRITYPPEEPQLLAAPTDR